MVENRHTRCPVASRHCRDTKSRALVWFISAAVLSLATAASAQTTTTPPEMTSEWQRGSTLSVFGGAASSSSGTDPGAGFSIGWEWTPRLSVEGRGLWVRADEGPGAFAGLLGTRFALRPSRPVVPIVTAAVGVHHAAFDSRSTKVPDFYQARINEQIESEGPGPFGYTFNDFLLSVGGGFDIFLTEHLVLRPEVSLLLTTTRSDTFAQALYGVHFAYHFEPHPTGN